MNYITKEDKQSALAWLNRFAQTDRSGQMTVGQYQRLTSWLNGMSYQEIAKEEGISAQAIGQSIKRELAKLDTFVKTQQVNQVD